MTAERVKCHDELVELDGLRYTCPGFIVGDKPYRFQYHKNKYHKMSFAMHCYTVADNQPLEIDVARSYG